MLTVQTSNASFIFTDQIEQQFAITRLRAIETGRWLAVASTNGLSGVIRPDGSVAAEADPQTTAVLVEEVDLMSGRHARRSGSAPGPDALLVAADVWSAFCWASITYRRKRESSLPTLAPDDAESRPDERQPA